MKVKTKIKIIETPKGYVWVSATRLSKNKVELKYVVPVMNRKQTKNVRSGTIKL